MAEENVNINLRVRGADQATRDINKLGASMEAAGKKTATAGTQFQRASRQFMQGGNDLKRVFNMLGGAAIGAGIGGVGAMGFKAVGSLASLPVFGMKEYQTDSMKALKSGLAGFGAGGMGGALAGGTAGGIAGSILGNLALPGIGGILGGAGGALAGTAIGGAGGSMIGMIGSMFAEATAKAEPFMQALLNMSTALQPLMDALVSFANILAPAFEACYPAILGLSNLMADFVNMVAGPAANAITQFAQVFAVVFGILGDTTQTTGTKIVDIFQIAIRGVATALDSVFIPIWSKMLDVIADMTASVISGIANTIANGLITAVKGTIMLINQTLANNPLARLMGFNGFDVSGLNPVDLSGTIKSWMRGMTDQYKMPGGTFNAILDKLGVSSVGDLAKKYNVDLSARGSAQKLTEAVKDLATKIDTKDMASKMTVEINVHQSFNGPVTQADLERANQGVYDSVAKSLKSSGLAI